MKIRNTTTGEIDELNYAREPHNTGNLVDDPAIVHNKETEEFEANQETIDWWTEYLQNESDYQDLYVEARAGLDPVAQDSLADEVNNTISGCEYGDGPVAGIAYLEKFMADSRSFSSESCFGSEENHRDYDKQGAQACQESEGI